MIKNDPTPLIWQPLSRKMTYQEDSLGMADPPDWQQVAMRCQINLSPTTCARISNCAMAPASPIPNEVLGNPAQMRYVSKQGSNGNSSTEAGEWLMEKSHPFCAIATTNFISVPDDSDGVRLRCTQARSKVNLSLFLTRLNLEVIHQCGRVTLETHPCSTGSRRDFRSNRSELLRET